MTTTTVESPFHKKVRGAASAVIWQGVALLVIGVVALIYPAMSTLVATLFVGWILIFSGAAMLFGAFSLRGAGPFFGALLYGLLSVAAGVFMIGRPGIGALALTATLGAIFMLQGAFETIFAFEIRPARGWGWMLMSALASILLSLAIISGWPKTSLITLGVIIGVNFVTSGVANIMVGATVRRELAA